MELNWNNVGSGGASRLGRAVANKNLTAEISGFSVPFMKQFKPERKRAELENSRKNL